ncbi:hypothetical protein BO71DRAFT_421102 [Aspergillus ellipticus CBS 707.79]|uniref:RNase H type-1 domain-containing protein n=1 Tax=Aspergillus ellipticus CBS 707.79 TaxID=1448320 RepID=A0A319DLC2_9EURO|nr:hypothetical protein BO71DRAFT_421102 [Aspergillus ellipticus CBS 707.79]
MVGIIGNLDGRSRARRVGTSRALFPPGIDVNATPPVHRFIRENDPGQLLLHTDGACLHNGGANPRASCGVVYRSSTQLPPGIINYFKFPLENKGPTGEEHPQTSNKAGSCTGAPVKNQDLWECLLGEVERWDDDGIQIQFWRISRAWNTEADYHAKQAAS